MIADTAAPTPSMREMIEADVVTISVTSPCSRDGVGRHPTVCNEKVPGQLFAMYAHTIHGWAGTGFPI